jgi:hypothetical protein
MPVSIIRPLWVRGRLKWVAPVVNRLGKSDPYAIVFWDERRVGQTKIIKNTLDPRWNGEFDLQDMSTQPYTKLRIEVYDHDHIQDEVSGLFPLTHPFNSGCLPLSYRGNPGVNDESYRGANWKRLRQLIGQVTVDVQGGHIMVSERFLCTPLQTCLCTPELQWQPRGKRRILQGCQRETPAWARTPTGSRVKSLLRESSP